MEDAENLFWAWPLEWRRGAALGMTIAPSHRQIKRAAHMAAKRVNEAVENLAEAMDL